MNMKKENHNFTFFNVSFFFGGGGAVACQKEKDNVLMVVSDVMV